MDRFKGLLLAVGAIAFIVIVLTYHGSKPGKPSPAFRRGYNPGANYKGIGSLSDFCSLWAKALGYRGSQDFIAGCEAGPPTDTLGG